MKVVVCDDDVTLRSVVSRLAESVGHSVIAETDSADDAVELVIRFGAEILVLDLSLPWGSGMRAVHELKARGSGCHIVVFTAYADESPDVRESAVRAVVEKPDFDALEGVLTQLAGGLVTDETAEHERRRPPRHRPRIAAPIVPSPSGLEEPASFAKVIDVLEPGDAVIVIHVASVDAELEPDPWRRLLSADRFLAIARELRTVLRVQDRLGVDDEQLMGLLLDGGRPGVESVWRRLERAQALEGIAGVLSGGWALCDDREPGYASVARARDAAQRSIGQPPGDRLWAG